MHGGDINHRPLPAVTVINQKMGIHEWSYKSEVVLDERYAVPHRDNATALNNIKAEVELGFDAKLALAEAGRCLNCDVETVFAAPLCIECDACVDICPMDCITFTENGEEAGRCARGCARRRSISRRTFTSPTASRPAASWQRTRTSACTAGYAPSAARPERGT